MTKQIIIMQERIIAKIHVAIYKIEMVQIRNAREKVAIIEKVIKQWQATHGINIRM